MSIHCHDDVAEALEQRFFALSVDMLCILGFDRRFRRVNDAWTMALGYAEAELTAQPFIDFVHPDDRQRTLDQNQQVQRGGQARSFENRYRCKDGSYRWLVWNSRPDVQRGVIYGIARDITPQKQAQHEREALIARLAAAATDVKTLRRLLPICSYCKRIRDDRNDWRSLDEFLARHADIRFTHGICPSCFPTALKDDHGE